MTQLFLKDIRGQIGQPGYSSLSPFALWLCGTIVDAQPGKMAMKFVVRREMTDEFGFLHNGILSGLATETALLGVHTLDLDIELVCTEINLEIHNKVGLAQIISARAELDFAGDELTASCQLHDEGQRLIAVFHCRFSPAY